MLNVLETNPFVCGVCGASYKYQSSLMRHTRYECGREKQFQCPYCPHTSRRKDNLVQHIKKQHPMPVSTSKNWAGLLIMSIEHIYMKRGEECPNESLKISYVFL